MSYGIQVSSGSGKTILDSRAGGFLFLDKFQINGVTVTWSISFPLYTGAQIIAIAVPMFLSTSSTNGIYLNGMSVTYPSGVPTITFTPHTTYYAAIFYVEIYMKVPA